MTSRREIKSWASGIANIFACSANHYAWLACHHRLERITIDLISLQIDPPEFDIERNRILAGYCRDCMFRNVQQLLPPANITEAILIADFEIRNVSEDSQVPLTTTVTLTDDRGKKWICVLKVKGVPIQK
jgi:hypothetical protein